MSVYEIALASGLEPDRVLMLTTTIHWDRRLIGLAVLPREGETDKDDLTILAPRDARELAAALLRLADELEQEAS